MVSAQGGKPADLTRITEIHRAPVIRELKADRSGRLTRMDARIIGQAILELGAGRARSSDSIDYAVGCDQLAKTGQIIAFGEVLLRIHARSTTAAEAAENSIRKAILIE